MSSQKKTDVLFVEKVNHKFKRVTGHTKQATGLTNCIDHIVNAFDNFARCEIDNLDHVFYAIQRHNPKKLIFEAIFATPEWVQKIRSVYPNLKMYMHLHSDIPFLATEGMAFHVIKQMIDCNVGIICNDLRTVYAIRMIVEDTYVRYLPNIYTCNFFDKIEKPESDFLDIACFGSIRPMKNQVNQAIAAMKFCNMRNKKLRFHTNLGRSESGDNVKASLKGVFTMNHKHELISHPWMSQKEFIQLLRTMDFGLQVSMSETFNLVAADYVAAGIPIVVSEEIKWAPKECQSKTSALKIHICMEDQVDLEFRGFDQVKICRDHLLEYVESAKRHWSFFLND